MKIPSILVLVGVEHPCCQLKIAPWASWEPVADPLQLLFPRQTHAGHLLSLSLGCELGGTGNEGLGKWGERIVRIDVGKILPTEAINVGQLVLVRNATDVGDMTMAGVPKPLLLSFIAHPSSILPLPRILQILDVKKLGRGAAGADGEVGQGRTC